MRLPPGVLSAPALLLVVVALLLLSPVALAEVHTVADRFVLLENSGEVDLRILVNDLIPPAELAGGSVALVRAPRLGAASIADAGTPATAADDTIRYRPLANQSGEDGLRYRVCGGGQCAEGEVAVLLRPGTEAVQIASPASSGFRDVAVSRLRALPSLRFEATRLARPQVAEYPLAANDEPWLPFAGAGEVALQVLRSTGQPRDWRVLVDARSISSGNVDLYVGLDLNRDGRATPDELRCASAMSSVAERCELAVTVPGCGNLQYWVMVVANGAASTARTEISALPFDGGDGSLVATGPGLAAAGVAFPIRIAWDQPRLASGESAVGFVRVLSAANQPIGDFPVHVQRNGSTETGTWLSGGVPRAFRLGANGRLDRVYIDVPPGASTLSVSARASGAIDLYLARVPAPTASAAVPAIAAAPAKGAGTVNASGVAAQQALGVSGASLAPGRWYVVASNPGAAPVDVTLSATLAANAPVVRRGGFYNTGRSGHGLYLYPAAQDWAGVWFTYLQDGSPTWYYLQAAAPGADGQWRSGIYRSVWDGQRNALTRVGEASTSATGPDAFTFSYRIDGETGSEAFSTFGRGCPPLAGTPLDVSSHWFNPARSGAGYSVQMFPDYEFYAVFVYDAAGIARFLIAERPTFGGATASATLQQLAGFCPLCARTGSPSRTTVGTLSRSFAGGAFSNLSFNAGFVAPASGTWTANEAIQLLGGAGTQQGCAP